MKFRKSGQTGTGIAYLIFALLIFLAWVAFYGLIIWAIWHFISKYW